METTRTVLFAILLTGLASAQELPTNDALQKAMALSQLEHDDAGARAALLEIVKDGAVDAAVRRHAFLRIGELARRMGDDAVAQEALGFAADGNDAVARLARQRLEQDPQDPERQKQLRERAEVALTNWMAPNRQGSRNDLRDLAWFGDTAAALLIREYERLLVGQDPFFIQTGKVVAALWQIDSDVARTFLGEQLALEDAERRRRVTTGMNSGWEIPENDLPLIRVALADSDAEVVVRALSRYAQLGVEELAPKISDPRVTVRLAALQGLLQWTSPRFGNAERRGEPDRRAESRMIARHIAVPLAATDPAEFRLAATLLCYTATTSVEGRAMLVRSLTKLGDAGTYARWPERADSVEFAGPNENAELLRVAFEELGPVPENPRGVFQTASGLYWGYMYLGNWDRGALDTAVTGARLGYGQLNWDWLDAHAEPEDAPRIVEAMADSKGFGQITGWLMSRDVPEICFDALRRVADARLAAEEGAGTTDQVLVAIGRTGHPDAAGYLRDVAARPDGVGRDAALYALAFAGQRRNDGPTRDAMRGALLAIDPKGETDLEVRALRLCGQLVHMGDVELFDHVDAVEGKTPLRRSVADLPGAERFWEKTRAGPSLGSWLAASARVDGVVRWWHGYDDEVLPQLWARLLAPGEGGAWRSDWDAVDELTRYLPDTESGIPGRLAEVLCEAFAARCSTDAELVAQPVLDALGWLLDPATPALWQSDAAVVAAFDALHAAVWTAPSANVRRVAVTSAAIPLDEARRAQLVRLLGDPAARVADAAWSRLVHEAGVPVDAELVASGLTSPAPDVRRLAMLFATTAPAGLGDAVQPALADPSETVRALACDVLGATLRLDVVPDLLEALKDGDPTVRDHARDALQAIRFYHDEKAHWDRVFAGKAGLTAASAAEALLEQAKSGNDTDTRVLAIRSLGVLGAPETLPFLIEWTKDENADVATAAREAIGAIHARK